MPNINMYCFFVCVSGTILCYHVNIRFRSLKVINWPNLLLQAVILFDKKEIGI